MQKRATGLEKIFMKDTSDKRMLSKIYKKKKKKRFISKDSNNSIKGWGTELNRPHQRRYTDTKLTHEKMFHIICHQRNENMTMRYLRAAIIMAKFRTH